jgi:hypothetical protein
MIRHCRRLHAPVVEIMRQFKDAIEKLRLVPDDPCRSRELWTCSPYGGLRFFQVLQNGLVELDLTVWPVLA